MDNRKPENKPTISASDAINKELIKNLKVHTSTNLDQEVIITTEDKVRISLMKYLNKMGKKDSWVAPGGILLTIVITLLTTNFKTFYFSADTWTAVFIIAGIISLIWLVYCLKNIFVSVEMDEVIDELKEGSPVKKDKGNYILIDKNNHVTITSEKP